MLKNKKIWCVLLTAGALGIGIVSFHGNADADLFSQCPSRSGFTRFLDDQTNTCGYVSGNNANWGALPGGWNDRADHFGNDGVTSSICLYQDINCHTTNAGPVFLQRGFAVTWSNIVSSNRWTTASSCPSSC
jgi:hypothetical protein